MNRAHLFSLAAFRPLPPLSLLIACAVVPGLAVAQYDDEDEDYYEEEASSGRRIAEPLPTAGDPGGAVESGNVGYELALSGATMTESGTRYHFHGVAYEVSGVATMRATPGLEIVATLEALTPEGAAFRTIETATVRATEGGHFDVDLPAPEFGLASPHVVFRVHRVGQPGRRFSVDVAALASRQLEILADRNRYEPGETLHVWARISTVRTGAPIAGRPMLVTLTDPAGAELARHEMTARTSGTVSLDIPLAATATPGTYALRVASDETINPATRYIEVFQRTTERIMASITLDQEIVLPGGHLTGSVRVLSPSGSPVRGAIVEFYPSSDYATPLTLTTGADGRAPFDATAPTYLSGDVASVTAYARIVHAALGTITAYAGYTMARTAFLVSVTPEAGGLVPELDSRLYVSIADPRGTPIRAGVSVEVRGLGLPGGRATVTTDAHGMAEVTVRLPRGAAARMDGGACAYVTSTSFEVEVQTTPAVFANVCTPVALTAEVLPRVRSVVVAPGANVEVDLVRVPGVSGRAVILEALYQGRVVASAWATGARQALRLPNDVAGVIEIRARAVAPADARSGYDEEGETVVGTGARAAVLVRPADAFGLTLTPGAPIYRVRERAGIALSTSTAPASGGWVTLVARDEAQHGGESDYAIESVSEELRAAVRAAVTPADERFVRAALAGGLAMETEVEGAAPIVAEPWDIESYSWGASPDGVLRDPISLREEMLRRSLTEAMMGLENLVVSLQGYDEETRATLVRRTAAHVDFGPAAMEMAGYDGAITLGGIRLTPAHLHEADATFSFDTVARRVARNRLVFLLLALSRLGNPDDEAALRASAGQPPDRWLSLLVQLGMVTNEQLVDPWGRAYSFRRVTGRSPIMVVSETTLEWELSSPGPDGVVGNGDDVRDPFARAVPEGSPYAVACGEDELMRMLSRIAPGNQVLAQMAQAYSRLGLAADEERRGGALTASMSEAEAYPMAPPPATVAMGGLGYSGYGGGGSGRGYGGGEGAMARATGASADYGAYGDEIALAESPAEDARFRDDDHDSIADADDRIDTIAAVIREDFPATLFFVGEVALDAAGRANVEIPLADAITTYRIEAIAWTSSGWTTSARTSVRVEQEAEVDSPVPEMAIVGDVIRMPVRVRNRGTAPLRVRFAVTSEGEVGVTLASAASLDVPAGEAVLTTIEVRPMRAGTGAIVVTALRDSDGAGLDAVRRPIEVVQDARLVRDTFEELVEDGTEVTFEVPAEASERGDGEARLRVAAAVFGAPSEWGASDPAWAAWAVALTGAPVPTVLATNLQWWTELGGYGDERAYAGRDAITMALVLGALWTDPSLTDDEARAILRFLSNAAGGASPPGADPYGGDYGGYGYATLSQPSAVLLALVPALRSELRVTVRGDLVAVAALLRDRTGSEGAVATDPETWSRVAAALALGGADASDGARAAEMMRRVSERHLIAVGNLAWIEPMSDDGSIEPRIAPTALFALARIGTGDARGALPLLRAMADVARGAPLWRTMARALACAAAAALVRGPLSGDVSLRVDGMPITLTSENGTSLGTIPGLGRPGAHTLVTHLSDGAIALLAVETRYAMPWTVPPVRSLPVELEWIGEIGPREARSGLALVVHNGGARVLVRPIVEIQLPAGAELDEPTREGLASVSSAPPALEGNVLRLELRPLAPGAELRLPIRVRWSLGGSFRGLGVALYDDASGGAGPPPTAVLASRAVEIADEGPEPAALDASLPRAPEPIPPPIDPLPRPLSEVIR